MATYFVGDVHGCCDELEQILNLIEYRDSEDRLFFTGDLVGRGPSPLRTLHLVRSLQQDNPNVQSVLGNHDLHLISLFHGGYELDKNPDLTLMQVLQDELAAELIKWLVKCPLLYIDKDFVLVHAGIPHIWDLQQAQELADYATRYLQEQREGFVMELKQKKNIQPGQIPAWRSTEFGELLHNLYGDTPCSLAEAKTHNEKLRVIINSFTRMRMCAADGTMRLDFSCAPSKGPNGYVPWFSYPRQTDGLIVFGHWAALNGTTGQDNMWAMDYGCAWGRKLAAKRLEDGKVFLVDSSLN